MNRKWLTKLKLGGLSLATLTLLVACGSNDIDEPTVNDEPAVEEPEENTTNGAADDSSDSSTEETQQNIESPSSDPYSDISIQPEDAFDLYLGQYPNAEVTQIQLDKEDGIYVYEVEGFEGSTEYELKIHSIDGTILKEDVDTDDDTDDQPLSRDQIAKVKMLVDQALTDAGKGSTLDEWQLDIDDGIAKLEVDLDRQDGEDEERTFNMDTGELIEIDN